MKHASELRHSRRIGQTMQPVRGGLGEAQQERPAARGRHSLKLGLAHDFGAVRIGGDEVRLERHPDGGRPLRNGEIEPVAAGGIVAPLAVGAKVRRLDLDDRRLAVAIDRRDVGAARG